MPTWHGPGAAAASLFGPSAGAEAAAVKGSAVAPQLPGHGQLKRRPLWGEERGRGERAPPGGRSWCQEMPQIPQRSRDHIRGFRCYVPGRAGLGHTPTQSRLPLPGARMKRCRFHRCCPPPPPPPCWRDEVNQPVRVRTGEEDLSLVCVACSL